VILQWQPDTNYFKYLNMLDLLAEQHPSVELPFLPAHAVLALPADATFSERQSARLAIMDANPQIKTEFLGEADWLNLFGPSIGYEVFGIIVMLQLCSALEARNWRAGAAGRTSSAPIRIRRRRCPGDRTRPRRHLPLTQAAPRPASLTG